MLNSDTQEKAAGLLDFSVFDVKSFLSSLTQHPGVYRMLGAKQEVLYVGKAKNLKNRVSSYFRKNQTSLKTAALVAKICSVEVTITQSETEALLLEQTLIKELRPPYNILLRDDKSYPFIFVSTESEYPRISFHRGARRAKGRYLGPYPSAGAVRESLNLLQKMFFVRQCDDNFFKNRSRACLQYQIKRCSGPCVGHVSAEDYAEDVRHTLMFLEGKCSEIADELSTKMEAAAEALEYEQAAYFRDQIVSVRRVQESQFVTGENGDVDVFAVDARAGGVCIQALFVRAGRVLGSKSYFPKTAISAAIDESDSASILSEFLPQYYLSSAARDLPGQVVSNYPIEDSDILIKAIEQRNGVKVSFDHKVRGNRAGWLRIAQTNAEQNITSYLANKRNLFQRFESLQNALSLDDIPKRLECFDISHTQGEATVASCVVFDQRGPLKTDYRRFNIEGITPGDDYAAMEQALLRRYTRLKKGEGKLPDILFIDGGKGQVTRALKVMEQLQIDEVAVVGVAKGESRKPGLETLLLADSDRSLSLERDSLALHLIQHIRDESHRFAITGHRQRRDKKRKQSSLEGIPGVGPKRRRQLLNHFGGLQEVVRASAKDIADVAGISSKIAEEIYSALHND